MTVEVGEPEVTLRMTVSQARAVDEALDLFVGLGLGKFDELAGLVAAGGVPLRGDGGEPRRVASHDVADRVREMARAIGREMGYGRGEHLGVGHRHVTLATHRAYEVHKVLAQAIANHVEPFPAFRGVNHDGLIVRYTDDPAPAADVAARR